MNMNRGLVLSLCAVVALGAMATASIAATDLSLNLRYTDPANPAEGGTWALVGITDDPDGLVGVSAYFSDIDTAGIVAGAGVNANINGGVIPVATFGAAINAVYGQDLSQAVTTGVGSGTMAINDPLLNPDWNGATSYSLVHSARARGPASPPAEQTRPMRMSTTRAAMSA
jgi:hypothetical protein